MLSTSVIGSVRSVFVWYGSPLHLNVEPLVFEGEVTPAADILLETVRIRRISQAEALAEAALVDTRLVAKAYQVRQLA